MKAKLQCQTCREVMGTLEKPEITADDVALYYSQTTCSQNHQATELTMDQAQNLAMQAAQGALD